MSVTDIIYTQVRFDLDALYADHPEFQTMIGSEGKDRRFRNNIFDKISAFLDEPGQDCVEVLGVSQNKRVRKYIERKYVDTSHENLNNWKVLFPRATGSGAFGEALATPFVVPPKIGYTQTFIGFGSFLNEEEAGACVKYIKTKFSRAMLGILKITQDNDRGVWRFVPLQDFTPNSDIDWSKSIPEIDKQLYAKYGLSQEEIDFIESHVKEMK